MPNVLVMTVLRFRLLAVFCVVVLLGACSSDAKDADAPDGGDAVVVAEPAGTGACDPTDAATCLLPWPNDRFTRADPSTPTKRRLDLPADGTPKNASEKAIEVAEWNRNDGFSPSSIGLTVVPHLDVEASALPPQGDIGKSLEPSSPLVVLDVTTGQRLAAWAETDTQITDPAQRLLRIVPAAGLPETHRIAIALRALKHDDGSAIAPTAEFAKLVDQPTTDQKVWLDALATAGVPNNELTLAWSFTVASPDSLSGRLRHMWNETAAEYGDGAPTFTVDEATTDGAVRVVRGTFEMPQYLTDDGATGTVLNNADDPNGTPTRNGEMDLDYVCTVPTSLQGDEPGPFVLYGHGLLGSRDEALGIGSVAAVAGVGFCAIDEIGMSSSDIGTVFEILGDASKFRTQPDRMQQGALGFLTLGRLLKSPDGFGTHQAFQDGNDRSVIDPDRLSFLGASQGGILGGASSALATDWTRVILAVGGMGYNLLLDRSIDFDEFRAGFEKSYTSALDRAIVIEMLEQLWDRGENTAYAQHLTAQPYENTPAKTVMLLEAFGDHQVANVSTEKLARTLGIGRRAPTLADGRSTDTTPFFGIDELPELPFAGSGLVVWDFGTPAPPAANTPPRAGDDPHGKLADVPEALALVAAFIQPDGEIIDVCNAGPCQTLP